MMRFGHTAALGALALVLLSHPAWAQTKDGKLTNATSLNVNRSTSGRILVPESIGNLSAEPVNPAPSGLAADRPDRPERFVTPQVREYLRRFRAAQEKYLQEQERLEKQLKGSTEQERQKIREQIKQSHDRWVAQARTFRDEARERQKELKRALPKHRDALNEARPGQRGRQPAGLD